MSPDPAYDSTQSLERNLAERAHVFWTFCNFLFWTIVNIIAVILFDELQADNLLLSNILRY